jgi:copper transport protein
MRRAQLAIGTLLLVGIVAGLRAQPVLGHALLSSSDPAANASLPTAPSAVTLTFTEPPDPKLSSVQVLDASGAASTTGPAVPVAAGSTSLRVPLRPLSDGVYTVAWRTVSAADGHSAAGSFAFSVGAAAPTASLAPGVTMQMSQGSSTVSAASIVSRWLLYLGLIGLLGAVFAAEVAARRRSRWLLRLTAGAWVVATAGAVLLVVFEASDAGVSVGDLAGTTLGWVVVARLVPFVIAGLLLFAVRRPTARRGLLLGLVGVIAALEMLVDAIVSHAAATSLPWANIALQWLHFLTVGIWLGGLVGILIELRGAPSAEKGEVVRRFSHWATIGLAVVALTGVIRAAFELRSIDELVTTDYGRLVLVKICLLVGLAGLGAINHFRNVPAAAGDLTGLRRVGSVEILLAAVVLFVASVLVNVAPPVDMAVASSGPTPSAPADLVVDGHDYATTVKLALTITPGAAGPNTFRATAVDYDTGAPVSARGISLRFAFPGRPDLGASALSLAPADAGTFAGSGANLSLGGAWSITALVETTTPVEVPLVVTVPTPPQQVDVNRALGQPTLYTVHLSNGRTAQLYLDQWAATAADLHVTYFDAAGKELPVTAVSATVSTAGGVPQAVALNQLEPGHVVGHVRTTAGTALTVEVIGTASGGERLDFRLDITPGR